MLVSILIPCHNAEKWIAQAIQSALSQTHRSCEVHVIDDGSTDGSLSIIKQFGNKITWTSRENRGSNVTRNELLNRARGDWVQFLDSDDYLETDKVSTQLREAQSDSDVLFSPVIEESWKGERMHARRAGHLDDQTDVMTHWLSWRVCQTGAALWKTQAIKYIGGWNEKQPCCQDNEIMLRAQQAELRLQLTPTARTVYRLWSDDTLCHRDPRKTLMEKTRLIDKALAWLKQTNQLSHAHIAAAEEVFYATSRTLMKVDHKVASNYLQERRERGLGKPRPTAATPRSYCLAFNYLGFKCAEQLASTARLLTNRVQP